MTRDFVHSHISRGVATVAGGNRAKSQDSLCVFMCVFVGAQLNEQLLYLVRDPGTRVDSLTGILPVKHFRTL